MFKVFFLFGLIFIYFHASSISYAQNPAHLARNQSLIIEAADKIQTRFPAPAGYQREHYAENSFGTFLRELKLKKMGSPVLFYNGRKKFWASHVSVLDIPILSQDLIQCADAVIKLRAEYLYAKKEYNKISFELTNGMEVPFSKFANGERVKVTGNKTRWVKGNYKTGYGRDVFEQYLKFIYIYAGTISLSKQMQKADIKEIEIGYVFIEAGSPGHAVIVVDIAVHKDSGRKIMLLAQSYMPSQDLHILNSNFSLSPWYKIEDSKLLTSEWVFKKGSLKTW